MDVPIVPFDPKTASREAWARFHAYRRLRHLETDPEDPDFEDATVEAWLRRGHPHWRHDQFAVLDPARPDVQIGEVSAEASRPGSPPHELNKHICTIGVELLRPHRRQGIGRAMFAKALAYAEADGRTAIESHVEEDDGKAVLAAIGARVVQERFENRLLMDRVDWPMLERWVAEGPVRSPHTQLKWFRNEVPEAIIDEYARVFTEVFNQQPLGEGSFKGIVQTPDAFRERAKTNAEVRGTWLGAYTEEPDGEISGLTELFYIPDQATFLGQGLTGVRERHTRRGLGKWLKAAMLLEARREFPQARVVRTGNAQGNAAMLSINNRMGFRPHKRPVIAEISVEGLRAYLAR